MKMTLVSTSDIAYEFNRQVPDLNLGCDKGFLTQVREQILNNVSFGDTGLAIMQPCVAVRQVFAALGYLNSFSNMI
jgi:hypothetical protein